MKLRFMLCSDLNILDANTNRVSCINIIEEINAIQVPAVLPYFSCLMVFDKEPTDNSVADAEIRISINREPLTNGKLEVDFQEATINRTMVSFQGFVVPAPGEILVECLVSDVVVGTWSVPVKLTEYIQNSSQG